MRNYHLDQVKGLATLAVVVTHVSALIPQAGLATFANHGWYQPLLEFPVPLFFTISGLILANRESAYLATYQKNILVTYLQLTAFYLITDGIRQLLTSCLQEGDVGLFWEWLAGKSWQQVINGSVGKYHLWYLWATFLALFIFRCLRSRLTSSRQLLALALVLHLASYILRRHDWDQAYLLYGGFPKALFFLALGNRLAVLQLKRRLPLRLILFSLIIYCFYRYSSPYPFLEDLLMAALVGLIILYALQEPGQPGLLSYLGQRSLLIYGFHVFFIELGQALVGDQQLLALRPSWLALLLLIIFSILASLLLGRFWESWRAD